MGYCYCCHLVRFTCWCVVFRPLAHHLVFPHCHHDTQNALAYLSAWCVDRGMVQDMLCLRLLYVLFCFAALASKLIFPWCFSSKRMLNRCCCIYPTAQPSVRYGCNFVCNSERKTKSTNFSCVQFRGKKKFLKKAKVFALFESLN